MAMTKGENGVCGCLPAARGAPALSVEETDEQWRAAHARGSSTASSSCARPGRGDRAQRDLYWPGFGACAVILRALEPFDVAMVIRELVPGPLFRQARTNRYAAVTCRYTTETLCRHCLCLSDSPRPEKYAI